MLTSESRTSFSSSFSFVLGLFLPFVAAYILCLCAVCHACTRGRLIKAWNGEEFLEWSLFLCLWYKSSFFKMLLSLSTFTSDLPPTRRRITLTPEHETKRVTEWNWESVRAWAYVSVWKEIVFNCQFGRAGERRETRETCEIEEHKSHRDMLVLFIAQSRIER